MPTYLKLEVLPLFESQKRVDDLLYTPRNPSAIYRQTRLYYLRYEGNEDLVKSFAENALVDSHMQKIFWNGEIVDKSFLDWDFSFDYGVKNGILDLECEALLKHSRQEGKVSLLDIKLSHRFYLFHMGNLRVEDLIQDLCNPLIHDWKINK